MFNSMEEKLGKGVLKRRSNILYKLRKKGVRVCTKTRTIFIAYGEYPNKAVQVGRLRTEYGFNVQFEIV